LDSLITSDQCSLTPPGYGFDTPASRIISSNIPGFVNCYVDELIPDVVGRMYTPEGGEEGWSEGRLESQRQQSYRTAFMIY